MTLKDPADRLGLSIFGDDDLPFSGFVDPPLTIMHQPIRATGRRCAEIVLARLSEPRADPVSEFWRPDVVRRAAHAAASGMAPLTSATTHLGRRRHS